MRSPLLLAQSQFVGVLSVYAPPAGQSKSWDHTILWVLGDVQVWARKWGESHHVLQYVHELGQVVQQPSSPSPVVWANPVSQ